MKMKDKGILGIQILILAVFCLFIGWSVYGEAGVFTAFFICVLWINSVVKSIIRDYYRRQEK